MSRPSIALALICKNEVKNLPILFDSIKDCFDEVHVTDTGSTDGTLEYLGDLVKSGRDKEVLGCSLKLHFFEWINDFSAARNFSFSNAKTDFVMWLDADDSLGNRENFILWRDTAMGLADYWLATYNYAFDNGKPVCTFARERVVRNPNKDVWCYFVHEGIKPLPGWRPQYAITWCVNHRRTTEDVTKDRGRNLGIFEKNKGKLDSRMTFYYGKELFETGKPMEAFAPLMDAISRSDLEIHDRILGIQYACYSAMQCNQNEKAIQLAHQGLLLDQNRAEYYSILGDSYLKAGNLKSAVPFFAAAKNCFNAAPPTAKYQGPVYNHESAYGAYPTEQLSKIYYSMADFDRAEVEANYGAEKFNSEPCKDIQRRIREARALTNPDKSQIVDTEDIVITTAPQGAYPWDEEGLKTTGYGGSESAAILAAKELRKQTGRAVIIFNPRERTLVAESGVEYRPIKDVLDYFSKYRPKLHIAWRHNSKITDAYTVHWVHDLVLQGAENGIVGDKVFCLSNFHKNYCLAMQGMPEDKIFVTTNGVDITRFNEVVEKDPNMVIFPSSPDRGLDRAMLIMDEARKILPDIELHVYYGLDNLEKYGLADMAKKLKAMMAERPWVKYHGNIDQKSLAKEMLKAGTWIYPANFIESQCIVANEAQLAGVYGIVRKIGALQDTYRKAHEEGRGELLDLDCATNEQVSIWSTRLIDAIQHKKWEKSILTEQQKQLFTWERVISTWLKELNLTDIRVRSAQMSQEERLKGHIDLGKIKDADAIQKPIKTTQIMENEVSA